MWSYSFTVFLSAFQLLPTAPFHIMSLGGSHRGGAVPRLSDLRVRDLGADHRRDRRSHRQAPRLDHREPRHHRLLAALRDCAVVSGDPGAGARAWRVLVGPAVELELVRDRHPAEVAPRRGHGLFRICQHPWRGRSAVDRTVAVRSRRLAPAVFRGRRPQRADGVSGVAAAAGSAACRKALAASVAT